MRVQRTRGWIRTVVDSACSPFSPLDFGDDMVAVKESELPDFVDFLTWGPTPATANQLLYVGNTAFQDEGIYRVSEGSAAPGEQL